MSDEVKRALDYLSYYKQEMTTDKKHHTEVLIKEVKRLQTIIHEIEHYNGVSAEVITASSDAEFVNDLLAEVKELRAWKATHCGKVKKNEASGKS